MLPTYVFFSFFITTIFMTYTFYNLGASFKYTDRCTQRKTDCSKFSKNALHEHREKQIAVNLLKMRCLSFRKYASKFFLFKKFFKILAASKQSFYFCVKIMILSFTNFYSLIIKQEKIKESTHFRKRKN